VTLYGNTKKKGGVLRRLQRGDYQQGDWVGRDARVYDVDCGEVARPFDPDKVGPWEDRGVGEGQGGRACGEEREYVGVLWVFCGVYVH
jgi:hypothetical protein